MKVKIPKHESINEPGAIARVFQVILGNEPFHDQEKEHFWMAVLTTKNTIKAIELVSLGTLNASLVHCRELFRFAILTGAHSIVTIHNHPSGDTSPSGEDQSLTRRILEAGHLLGIELLDHVIIGPPDQYYSFKQTGLI
jgi:DNA repair protein RadC